MTKQDPVEGRQRETQGDKPGNHDETRSSRRETKGNKPGNHDETRSSSRREREKNAEITTKQDPVEG